ncbi:MAG: glycerate kinase [Gemmatimonadota bacterium]
MRETRSSLPSPGERRLYEDADSLISAALRAVEPCRLVEAALEGRPPQPAGELVVISVGKAARAMAEGARRVLGSQIGEGILLLPRRTPGAIPEGFATFPCGHPLPDQGSLNGSRAVLEAARRAHATDLVLLLISGGASACLTLPQEGISLDDLRETTDLLLKAGALIQEVNAVRKHLDRLKGGQMARAAAPASILALLLSDVPGDLPDVIGSGPVSPDNSTFADASDVLKRYGLWERVPDSVRRHVERGLERQVPDTPKEAEPDFDRVQLRVIGNSATAVGAARREAERRGYRTIVLSTELTGEARAVGSRLAGRARELREARGMTAPPTCVLAGGETTVTVIGGGRGGRNQELALSAALVLDGLENVLVASVGTDGVDGPTDAAGARATGSTVNRARSNGLDPAEHLASNDAYPLFRVLDDLILTGPTGTNVSDLMMVLVGDSAGDSEQRADPERGGRTGRGDPVSGADGSAPR